MNCFLVVVLLNAADLLFGFRVARLVATLCSVVATAMWWFAMDTVVDDRGVRTQGRWFKERIAWSDVRRVALDRDGKPVLVLVGSRRRKLNYVPVTALEQLQQRWLHAGRAGTDRSAGSIPA